MFEYRALQQQYYVQMSSRMNYRRYLLLLRLALWLCSPSLALELLSLVNSRSS